MTNTPSNRRRWIMGAVRVLILAAVLIGVSRTSQHAVSQLAEQHWHVEPAWLAASGALYIAGLGAMACFWRHALAALGQPVPWQRTLYVYYLGHLGKYVPGKALVVVLRVAAIRDLISSTWLAVVSTFLETLMMMAVGACLGATFAAMNLVTQPLLAVAAAAVAACAFLPTLPPIAHKLSQFGHARFRSRSNTLNTNATSNAAAEEAANRITWPLWFYGCLAAGVCWLLLGLSLWATLRAIGVDHLQPIADGPLLVGAVSLAVVAGFLSFLPGGLVVRDALLMQILAPACGEADALIAAILLRLVWLVSELLACGILYIVALRVPPR